MSLRPTEAWVCLRHGVTREPCPCVQKDLDPAPARLSQYQHYWCCEHHRSAIENFFKPRHTCEWGCQESELKWYDHGKNQLPKSWAA